MGEGAIAKVWGRSPQPPESRDLEAKLPSAGSEGAWGLPRQFLQFFKKITHF